MIGMEEYPDKYFDLAIVDPPYGIGFDREYQVMSAGIRKDGSRREMKTWNNPKPKNYKTNDWDRGQPPQSYFDGLFRVSKSQIIWGENYIIFNQKELSTGRIVWDKGVPDGMSLSQCEIAWASLFNKVDLIKVLWAGYKKEEPEDRIHPTQKPVKLYKWLLTKYAKPNDKILDTHVGSASSLIACEDMGFEYVGFELDEDYYDAAQKRLSEFRKQLKLSL